MTIKKSLAALVVSAVAFSFVAAPVQAAGLDPAMQALFESLGLTSSQIAQVSALLGGSSSSSSSMVSSGYKHTVTLQMGARGSQVVALQEALNFCWDAGLVADGAFGPASKAAVMSAQAELGLGVDGIVGPNTGSRIEKCSVGTSSTGNGSSNDDDEDNNSSSSNKFESGSGDEASFDSFDMDDASDSDLEEGQEMAVIAEMEFDVEDADALLERLDVVISADTSGADYDNTDEDDPWKVFDTIYVIVNGDEVASIDADDDDDWKDQDVTYAGARDTENRFRISGIDEVLEKDETVKIEIAVDIASTVDITGTSADFVVVMPVDGIRMLDEAGITQNFPTSEGTATFSIEEEGGDDQVKVSASKNDPDSATLEVDTTSVSDEYHVFSFDIEADEDGSDLVFDKIYVSAESGTEDLADVIDDAWLEIDGMKENVKGTFPAATTGQFYFEFDDDLEINSGDEEEAMLTVKFKSTTSGGYANGETVQFMVQSTDLDDWTVEGADDVSNLSGSATGDVHTLFVDGVNVKVKDVDYSETVNDSGQVIKVTYEIDYEVSAFGETAYIPKAATRYDSNTAAGATQGLSFQIEDDSDADLDNATEFATSATVSSTADVVNSSWWRVDDGDTETFTATISVTTAGATGFVRAQMLEVRFDDNASGAPSGTLELNPAEDYETPLREIDA